MNAWFTSGDVEMPRVAYGCFDFSTMALIWPQILASIVVSAKTRSSNLRFANLAIIKGKSDLPFSDERRRALFLVALTFAPELWVHWLTRAEIDALPRLAGAGELEEL